MKKPLCVVVAIAACLLIVGASLRGAPAVEAQGRLVAKSLQVENLTVKVPGSKSSVDIMAGRDATGIWVSTGKEGECVGLVVQKGVGPYLAIYDGKHAFPAVALASDHLQFPKDGTKFDVTVVSLNDVVAAARAAKQDRR